MSSPKRGRPVIDLDMKRLEAFAEMGCTNKEMAAALGVSERTIDSRRRSIAFRTVIERGDARGTMSLRRKQMSMALSGDRTMLIWLGKQRLGQKDRIATEHSGKIDNGPPPHIHVNFVSPEEDDK